MSTRRPATSRPPARQASSWRGRATLGRQNPRSRHAPARPSVPTTRGARGGGSKRLLRGLTVFFDRERIAQICRRTRTPSFGSQTGRRENPCFAEIHLRRRSTDPLMNWIISADLSRPITRTIWPSDAVVFPFPLPVNNRIIGCIISLGTPHCYDIIRSIETYGGRDS